MNATDLRALLTARRAQYLRRVEDHRKNYEAELGAANLAQAHLDEIGFALEQLEELPKPTRIPKDENNPRINQEALVVQCAAAIAHWKLNGIGTDDRSTKLALKEHGFNFGLRTVRKALAKIGKESSVGAESSSPPKEVQAIPPVADNSGAGALPLDHPDRPHFLDRAPSRAAE